MQVFSCKFCEIFKNTHFAEYVRKTASACAQQYLQHPILFIVIATYRSSHRRCSIKKGVLRNFTKFTGKHVCQSLFIKKETLAQVFSREFCEVSKNTFSTEHLRTTASVATLHMTIL